MHKKILLVGPVLPPIHGQSLAFTRFHESINEDKIVINTNTVEYGKVHKLFATLKIFFLIFYKIFTNKINVVYFTCTRSFIGSIKDVILIELSTFKNIKLINHLHGSDFYQFLHNSPNWYKKILFNAYGKVDTSIVLHESMKNQFEDFSTMNIEVVPNFYDNGFEVELAVADENNINILYLSNIIKSKGIFELIEAFKELSTKYEDLYLNIAGDFMGDEYLSRSEVKKQFFDKINNIPKINYLGKVFGVEKVTLFQRSDIFVLPSYYRSEAFPISIIEAMRCGNAIIATNYKYLPEIVKSKNGILVEPKSVDSLIKGMNRLVKDNKLRNSIQSHNKKEAKEKYSLEKYIDKLNKIILEKV